MLFFRIIFTFLIFYIFNISAQSLKFEKYSTRDGLLSENIYNLHEDNKGYLWLFTDNGVQRYDGKEFERVLKNLPYEESFMYSIFENSSGDKWVANSKSKIYRILNDSAFVVEGTEKISEELKNNVAEIFQIYVDDSLNIFICTKANSYKFIYNKFNNPVKINQKINSDSVLHIAIVKQNTVLSVLNFAGRQIRNFYLNRDFLKLKILNINQKDTTLLIKCRSNSIPKIFKKIGNEIYFSFHDKIVKIDKNYKISYITINSIVQNFTKDKNGHLWVACYNNGLIEFDTKGIQIAHYFKNITVNDVLCDSQNGLWVSTVGHGLFHCNSLSQFYLYNNIDEIGNLIFIKNVDDELVVANNIGELFLLKNDHLLKIASINQSHDLISDVVKYKGSYIVSTRHNTYELNGNLVKNYLNDLFYSYKISLLGRDTVVLTARKDIYWVVNKKIINHLVSKSRIYDAVNWNNGILIATDDGIFKVDYDSISRPIFLNDTKNKIISKITIDQFNNLWISTKGKGLFRVDGNNKISVFLHAKDEVGLVINDTYIDEKGDVFVATNKGLYEVSNSRKVFEIYSGNVFNIIGKNGEIYFLNNEGLVFSKDFRNGYNKSLRFNLKNVLVNDKLTNEKQLNDLNYLQNNIKFNFDILSFSSPRIELKYDLIGSVKLSGISNNQNINILNISPGSYTLNVYYLNDNFNITPISIPFKINAAFWQKVWFKILLLLIIVLSCFFIGWEIFKYHKKKEDKKNKTHELILEYKLIALKAQINPHFISNCLTAIQYLIFNGKIEDANQYLAKFSLLIRQVLNFSSKSLVTLREELELTQLNIQLEQLRFDKGFRYILIIGDNIDLSKTFIPPLIFQPIVENAIWHGLLPIKEEVDKILQITINAEENSLIISIEDNGVGRKFNKPDITNNRESKGIEITKQRIENLNQLYKSTIADFIIEDLLSPSGKQCGTIVKIIIPKILFPDYE